MTSGGSAVWLVARADLRRHPVSTLALAALVGIASGVTLAAITGSRRVDTSFERLQAATTTANIEVEFESPPDPSALEAIGSIPGVEGASHTAFVAVAPGDAGVIPFADTISFAVLADVGTGSSDGLIEEGRALGPNPDEVLLNRAMADTLDVDVGDRIPLVSLSPESGARILNQEEVTETDGPRTIATVVGITKGAEDVADAPEPYLLVPAAYVERYDVFSLPILINVRATPDRVEDTIAAIRSLFPEGAVGPTQDFDERIADGIRVQSVGLLALALAVALMGAVTIVQQVARSTGARSSDGDVHAALGATTRQRRWVAVARATPIALLGAALATIIGTLGGPLTITGLARQAEPDPGIWFDWPTIVAVASVSIALVLTPAWFSVRTRASRATRAARRRSIDRGPLDWPLPVLAALGARRALGRQSARWSGREAVGALAAAVLVVVAVVTYSQSVDVLFESPAQWGVNFDAYVMPGTTPEAFTAAIAELGGDDKVEGVTVVSESDITLRRPDSSEFVARINWAEPAKGSLDPWVVVDGDQLRSDDEALVGKSVLHDMGIGIGDRLDLETDAGSASLRVVGRIVSYGNDRIDDGIAITPEAAGRVYGDRVDPASDSTVLVVRFDDSADRNAALDELERRYSDAGRLPVPGTIDNLDELGLLPVVLGIVVAMLGIGAVAHSLAMSVGRDLGHFATLRSIGATRRQLVCVVMAQALTLGGIAALLGVPAGIVLGRVVYRAVAEGIGAIARPEIASVAVVEVVVGALLVVLAMAALPARRAARPPLDALRSE